MEGPRDPVVIGIVGAPHGVRGTVRVRATGSGQHIREGVEPFVGGSRYRILRARSTPKGFLVDLDGVGDRAAAGSLRGRELMLDREELDPPPADGFYVADLIGLRVLDGTGAEVGAVAGVFETPAHEVLVVRSGAGADAPERYVPFTMEHVPDVDLRSGHVVVRFPEE